MDMKTIILLLSAFLALNCGQKSDKTKDVNKESKQMIMKAEQTTIDGLQNALTKLKNGQTEFDFIGITSNGIDCIYFVHNNEKFNLEFEAVSKDQLPYIKKLEGFANSNDLKSVMTTYGNKPLYESDKSAPVIRIETNYPLNEMTKFGEKVQSEIFNNNSETVYDIVP